MSDPDYKGGLTGIKNMSVSDDQDKVADNTSIIDESAPGSADVVDADDDILSVHTGTDGATTGEEDDSKHDKAWKKQLAQRETRAVLHLRVLVFMVLVLAAIAISLVVYYITKNAQDDEFETQYSGNAEKIKEAFQGIAKQKVGAISAVGVATIAHGVDHLRSWPFVTLSSFQQRCATARSLSGALFVSINPYVNETNRPEWERYVVSEDSYWIEEGHSYQELLGLSEFDLYQNDKETYHDQIFRFDSNGKSEVDPGPGPYMPVWQTSPVLSRDFFNQNLFANPVYSHGSKKSFDTAKVIIGAFETASPGYADHPDRKTSFYATLLSMAAEKKVKYDGGPISNIYLPVFSNFDESRTPVAVMMAIIDWASYFRNVLPPTVNGMIAILSNPCDGSYTFQIDAGDVTFLGPGNLHDSDYEYLMKTATFENFLSIADGTKYGLFLDQDDCPVSLEIYPSATFQNAYKKNTPFIVTFSVALVFAFTALMFLVYDRLVERRQHIVLRTAENSNAIVSSLFPKSVRDRLMKEREGQQSQDRGTPLFSSKYRLKSFLDSGDSEDSNGLDLQPIADLFPHTTVMFADIAGFTAWSSAREPAQVFILLQNLYQAFDRLAKRFKVFKVETIGDSYVAVTGLPDPQERHAVIMARFASACLVRMKEIVQELEVTLGPETCGLQMRFGMHSGPVTAGVLRGDRARFQLFGDTVNTAARMESTGKNGRIQCSGSTAELILEAGKGHWITPRQDPVQAKGKGVLNTFWVTPHETKRGSGDSGATSISTYPIFVADPEQQKFDRLVDWMCELLQEQIKKIIAARCKTANSKEGSDSLVYIPKKGQIALDEVTEIITLPEFDARSTIEHGEVKSIEMSPAARAQLRMLVLAVARSYNNNFFHCWEHACHVSMSVNKLLKRVVNPEVSSEDVINNSGKLASHIHDYTHGINSDPVTILAILFSAMIHDSDHQGIGNMQLMKENEDLAKRYRNKSVAEQNSFDLCWDMLMSNDFSDLRRCMFTGRDELCRFRQVVLNCVLATDIFDKELNQLRKQRWDKAFSTAPNGKEANDLRATIVIEHIIQASDVSHTMQHWHVYRKWNTKFFFEMYHAYLAGRMDKDPATFWYKGELGFFDGYIIPLAMKLKECNVFGVSSDEYLSYAKQNRAEWEERGMKIVEEMKEKFLKEASCRKKSISATTPSRCLCMDQGSTNESKTLQNSVVTTPSKRDEEKIVTESVFEGPMSICCAWNDVDDSENDVSLNSLLDTNSLAKSKDKIASALRKFNESGTRRDS